MRLVLEDCLRNFDADALTRVEYAHLVRKGQGALAQAHAVELLGYARAPLPNADSPCYGALGAYRMDLPVFAWIVRAGFCSSTLATPVLNARTNEFDFGVRGVRTFDLTSRVALDAGIGLSAVYFEQRFDSTRHAPTRRTWGSFAELVLGMSFEVTAGTYVALDVALQSYVLPMLDAKSREDELEAAISARAALGAGARF
jgi:hypothetical protein